MGIDGNRCGDHLGGQEVTTSMMKFGRVDGNLWGTCSEVRQHNYAALKLNPMEQMGVRKTQRNFEKCGRKPREI